VIIILAIPEIHMGWPKTDALVLPQEKILSAIFLGGDALITKEN
jgi:hypothetical protein